MFWSELCHSVFWYVGTNILDEHSATTLNMKAEFFSEMVVTTYQTVSSHNSKTTM
jgi:hypothetical protein